MLKRVPKEMLGIIIAVLLNISRFVTRRCLPLFFFNSYSRMSMPMGNIQCKFDGERKEEGRKKKGMQKKEREREGIERGWERKGGEVRRERGRKRRGPMQCEALRAQGSSYLQKGIELF